MSWFLAVSTSFGVVPAALIGAASGLHVATWGMYKDALYEGFSARKYCRSVIAGAGSAVLIQLLMRFDPGTPGDAVLLFALAYVLERALVEWHKTFIREEDQSKYFIPMQFAVAGRVVSSRRVRAAAGIGCATAVALVVLGLGWLEPAGTAVFPLGMVLVVGSIGGWISAFGGAWKDAPKEGFQLLKFFRSPALATAYGLVLSSFTTSYLAVAFGALGLTIATIETHKKFGWPLEAPGKFTGKPMRFPEMLRVRRRFVPVFAALWIALLATLLAALFDAPGGLLASIALAEVR